MPAYFVTGVAGFIASKVCELLLDEGHTIVGVDELNDAYDVRLKHWRLERLRVKDRFRFAPVDIRDRAGLAEYFRGQADELGSGYAAVINLAARAGVRQSVENPWVYYETNTTGTLNLLELCRESDVPKFVLASTSSLYGARNATPYREDADTDGPLSPYAASKKAAEVLCHTYHYLYGIDVSIVRYFTVYGPAGRPDMSLFRFVQWIHEGQPLILFGDGTQERDFTYVEDVARATIASVKPLGYQIMNVGSDKPIVLNDAIRLIERLSGSSAKIERQPAHPADVHATWADITKAGDLLGWRPEVDFEEGVTRLVEWYRENRDWAKAIDTR
jgi:nucleoside-diphosphate-sugar epimerase